jgi:adenine-specific DNA-methyltransferase
VYEVNGLELGWTNKHLRLHAVGEDGYEWIAPEDPRITEVKALRRVLTVPGRRNGTEPQGSLIAGDALDALQSLRSLPDFSKHLVREVRLVYIDPPFNRGQGFAQYGDSLEHAVWLSMLRDRLAEVKPLLAPLASIWVHLDDAEAHRGRCVLDEVFGREAFVATIVWQTRTTRESRSAFSSNHDYIHVYAPCGPQIWKTSRNLLPKDSAAFRNRDNDPRGPWTDAPFTAPGYRANQQYPIVNPAGEILKPPKGRSWYATEPVYKELLREGRIWFPRKGAGLPRIKLFPQQVRGLVPFSLWSADDCGTNDDAKRHLMSLFPEHEPFATPKPEALLERIIHIASDPGDLVLDFFAGSGTTAAVAHKMSRRWIAIERSRETVANIALPRLRKVISGKDPGGVSELVEWKGGGAFSVLEVVSPRGEKGSRSSIDLRSLVSQSKGTSDSTADSEVGVAPLF